MNIGNTFIPREAATAIDLLDKIQQSTNAVTYRSYFLSKVQAVALIVISALNTPLFILSGILDCANQIVHLEIKEGFSLLTAGLFNGARSLSGVVVFSVATVISLFVPTIFKKFGKAQNLADDQTAIQTEQKEAEAKTSHKKRMEELEAEIVAAREARAPAVLKAQKKAEREIQAAKDSCTAKITAAEAENKSQAEALEQEKKAREERLAAIAKEADAALEKRASECRTATEVSDKDLESKIHAVEETSRTECEALQAKLAQLKKVFENRIANIGLILKILEKEKSKTLPYIAVKLQAQKIHELRLKMISNDISEIAETLLKDGTEAAAKLANAKAQSHNIQESHWKTQLQNQLERTLNQPAKVAKALSAAPSAQEGAEKEYAGKAIAAWQVLNFIGVNEEVPLEPAPVASGAAARGVGTIS